MDKEEGGGRRRPKPLRMVVSALRTLTRTITAIKSRIPFLRKLHLNFIFLHYVYILSWIIICSVMIYPDGQLRYIDALFFASGTATQSGLNTVDLNRLHTYQQVILYIVSIFTTPIFIHSCVVFVRLYWFEKRFQHVVHEAKAIRSTRSRARTFTGSKDDQDLDMEERGIGGRPIVVLRNDSGEARGGQVNHRVVKTPEEFNSEADSPYSRSSQNSDDRGSLVPEDRHRLGLGSLRVPTQLSPEHHIAFLERQRRNKGALRIPSPREYDRGGGPQTLEEEDEEGDEVTRTETCQSDRRQRADQESEDINNIGPLNNHIIISEPDLMRTRTRGTTLLRTDTRASLRESFARSWQRTRPLDLVRKSLTQEKERPTLPYLSWNATVGRNSKFVDLSEEQRNELGGIEYRALKTLAVVLIAYYVFFHVFGLISLVGWIMCHPKWGSVVKEAGQGRPWWGIFMAASAFNDVGFTLTPDSMNSFQTAIWPLLLMTFLIIIGNTGFPCMLRLIIWVTSKIAPTGSALWEELRFLLDHPRRCFTLLFPRNATWWLFAILIILNGVDLIFFIILDLNDPVVTDLSPGIRVLDGLFQAASTRTAGFGVVNLADLHPAIQVSYLIMMYISVFPIAISMRRTNVYEEKSLGIYSTTDEESDEATNEPSYIGAHLRKQLSFDLWYVFLGLFIIAIAEGGRLRDPKQPAFQMFAVLFEIVSAYGTVGLSLGYPDINASFSAEFNVISKLVIIAMQIRGRHRGLPYALDRAILLPSEYLQQNESADAERRTRRRESNASKLSRQQSQTQSRPEAGLSTGMETQDYAQPSGPNRQAILRRQSTLR